MTGFGVGWVNSAADYSRYLPRTSSSRGRRSAGRRSAARRHRSCSGLRRPAGAVEQGLFNAIARDPIGALTTLLPTWYLVPFALVAVAAAWSAAPCSTSTRPACPAHPRAQGAAPVAAGIDGVIMCLGTIYIVFVADNFIVPFHGFLITLGVPIAAWAGVFLADLLHAAPRRTPTPSSTTRAAGTARCTGPASCWSSSARSSAGGW